MPRTCPEHLRDNWGLAYQHLFVQSAPPAYIEQFTRFKEQAGVTDRLIVAVIERAIDQKRRHPLAWAQTVIAGLVPYDVKTPEEWATFEADQAAEDERLAQERAAAQASTREAARPTGRQNLKPSNVFLKREKKDDSYYDYIFRKLDDPPGGGN